MPTSNPAWPSFVSYLDFGIELMNGRVLMVGIRLHLDCNAGFIVQIHHVLNGLGHKGTEARQDVLAL